MNSDKEEGPQQRSGPFPVATPRIPKGVGRSANPTPSFEPPGVRKAQQSETASYVLPGKPNRQLTKHDLIACSTSLLTELETIANSHPYDGNVFWRNELILDNVLRTS